MPRKQQDSIDGFEEIPLIAERELIACLISNPSLIENYNIDDKDFWYKDNKKLFKAVLECSFYSTAEARFEAVLSKTGLDKGYFSGIDGLWFYDFLKQVRANNKKRTLTELVLDNSVSVEDFVATLEEVVYTKPIKSSNILALSDIADKHMEEIENNKKQLEETGVIGFPTGIPKLDKYVQFTAGKFIILGARQSVGKSVMAMNITMNACIERGAKVLFISLEMEEHEIANRILSHVLKINHEKLINGQIKAEEKVEARNLLKSLNNYYILNCPSATIDDIKAYIAKVQPDIVVIDHLDLMDYKVKGNNTEASAIGNVTKQLKALAKQYKLVMIGLSQFNRKSDDEENPPKVSELRNSGTKEQDSDVVMILHRRKHAEPDEFARLLIEKNRSGILFEVNLIWEPQTLTFKQAYEQF